jgi:peptidoglycan-N-acetylglucosamine deacetylase
MQKNVPVLITWDVDPTPEVSLEHLKESFCLINDLLQELRIASTFLFVSEVAQKLIMEISALLASGQEIGCHGLTHDDTEEYHKMPEAMQVQYLQQATEILNTITKKPVITFRGPRVKTSSITQKILEELGYKADVSVSSQRIDIISSNFINWGWIIAPRSPYHPNDSSAFKRGNRKIWVVPISAIVFPFISSTLNIFGVTFMKLFFKILYAESLRNGKPIVYLIHPDEFAPKTIKIDSKVSFLKNLRIHGFALRSKLYTRDERKRFENNKSLFYYMKSFPNVQFMTVNDYVASLNS